MTNAVSKLSITALALIAAGFAGNALAQDKPAAPPAKEAAAAAKPAAGAAAPAAAAENKSSWVKLCDKAKNTTKDKDGKDATVEKNVCMTFHETIDANTGAVVVAASIREIEGDPKPDLQVTVPLGMVIPAGSRISVLSQEQADKLKTGGEIEFKDIKEHELKFSSCLPMGCVAESEAPEEIIAGMKKGGALFVRSVYFNGQPFSVPVPLAGFEQTLSGKPTDNSQYKKARVEMMQALRKRQAELMDKFKAEQKAKSTEAAKDLPAAPDAGAKPAEKK